jgi:hypothetical protein
VVKVHYIQTWLVATLLFFYIYLIGDSGVIVIGYST